MKSTSVFGVFAIVMIGSLLLAAPACAGDKVLELEALLIWGTNDPRPQDKKIKPVEEAVGKKLEKMPFKWKYYYEVTRRPCLVEPGKKQKVRMSRKCEISVRKVDEDKIEFTLIGQGKKVGRVTQELPQGEILVVGGNAENFTSWFVVLRHAK